MERIDATQVRRNFVEVADRVRYRRERVVVQRNGRDLVAIVPVEDAVALARASDGAAAAPAHIDRAAVRRIIARTAALPVLDRRTPDEILGYDEIGLPS